MIETSHDVPHATPQAAASLAPEPSDASRAPAPQERQRRADPRVVRSRAKVLHAAVDVLREQGPAALTVDEVIRRSGVARMTVYRHWPSREDLLLDAFRALLGAPTAGAPPAGAPTADATPGPHGSRTSSVAGRPRTPPTAADRLTTTVVALGRELASAEWVDALPALLDHTWRHPEQPDLRAAFTDARRERLAEPLAACRSAGLLANDLGDDVAVAQLLGPLLYRRLFTGEPITYLFCVALVEDLLLAHPG